jgi:large repetitive protein
VTSSTSSVCTASGLAVAYVGPGTCTLTAHVAAGADYTAADGSPQSFTVSASSSSTVLTSSANPSVYGQPVTFTATVSAAAPSFGTPTGSVTFTLADPAPTTGPGKLAALVCKNGDVVALASGQATCTISGLALAQTPTTVNATYSGESGTITGSTATELTQTVDKSPSAVTISAKTNPTVTSKAASFSAIVAAASPGAGHPTGTVTWTITSASGTAVPCSSSNDIVNKTSGKTTCNVAAQELFAANGPYTVSVAYSGDGNFTASTGTFTQDIDQAGSKTTVTVSAPAASGSPATVTATVTGIPASAGTPTGTVMFALTSAKGSVVDCDTSNTSTLSAGVAKCTVTSALVLSGSPYSVVAAYSGDGNFTSSKSAPKAIKVPR